jgi:hypothetical protein
MSNISQCGNQHWVNCRDMTMNIFMMFIADLGESDTRCCCLEKRDEEWIFGPYLNNASRDETKQKL